MVEGCFPQCTTKQIRLYLIAQWSDSCSIILTNGSSISGSSLLGRTRGKVQVSYLVLWHTENEIQDQRAFVRMGINQSILVVSIEGKIDLSSI